MKRTKKKTERIRIKEERKQIKKERNQSSNTFQTTMVINTSKENENEKKDRIAPHKIISRSNVCDRKSELEYQKNLVHDKKISKNDNRLCLSRVCEKHSQKKKKKKKMV